MPHIELVDITKRFGAVAANDGVSIDFREGEIHALLGAYRDAFLVPGFEARHCDLNAITSRHQVSKNERSRGIGRKAANLLGQIAGEAHTGAHD